MHPWVQVSRIWRNMELINGPKEKAQMDSGHREIQYMIKVAIKQWKIDTLKISI